MRQHVTVAASEREIYRDYERDRRLHLARILLPIFASIQFAIFLVSVLVLLGAHYGPPIRQIFTFNTALVGMCALAHAAGLRFAQRGQITAATFSVIIPVGTTVVVPILVYDVVDRSSLSAATSPILVITLGEMVGTFALIVLAGLLATNRWVLVATTVLMNVFTVFILVNALQIPAAGAALRDEAVLLIAFPLFAQWAIMGLHIAASGTYLKTLRELGDVRVAYERAQQLDQLKDQFISHVNHELRSPVMALHGHVELLLLTDETLAPEERHTYLVRAKRAGDALVALVQSILAAQRLDREVGAFVPEAAPVGRALETAIELLDPGDRRQVERELRVHIPADLEVWADRVRLQQILTNLLSNAIKYSPPGTPVEVAAQVLPAWPEEKQRWPWVSRAVPQQRPMVVLAVRDYGLGIPPDQIQLLFKRFVRLPRDLASSVPGNGLGLYLCRAYAEAMGGTIWVESTGIEGEGSTFHLQLPLASSAAGQAIVGE
jgi:signal transduction histidine kinase